ncbi:MAG TPA: hypothetical protein VL742_19985 [Casimicrobiaceae bacterium]|nr:hypothetical protein [Casimicrobiaceae bacterium]
MTLRYTLLGSLLATVALLPLGARAQSYYVYRSPTIVYQSPPPEYSPPFERVTRYWDADRGMWVERRVVENQPSMHWVPERRLIQPDGSEYIESGHLESDR